jgi:hypothetical protein
MIAVVRRGKVPIYPQDRFRGVALALAERCRLTTRLTIDGPDRWTGRERIENYGLDSLRTRPTFRHALLR